MMRFTTAESHQYIDRSSQEVREERLSGDRLIRLLYSEVRENSDLLFRALTGAHFTQFLGFLNYDLTLGSRLPRIRQFREDLGISLHECLEPSLLTTPRRVFERRIRYWECRPMPADPAAVVSPSDARLLVGSLAETSALFLKQKFFDLAELLGPDRHDWMSVFAGGDFAVFRLTPEKYHYNHVPVDGRVEDLYELRGRYHSCNPTAAMRVEELISKNKRVVTIFNTDLPNGTGIGRLAMIEIAALMIGEIVSTYSEKEYQNPQVIRPGMLLRKGSPKSLFRPGSSTVVLICEPGRVRFDPDILQNLVRPGIHTRFADGL